jgi:hypothetical protein
MAVVMTESFDSYNGTGSNTGQSTKWGITGTSLTTGRFGTGQAMTWAYGASGTQSSRVFPNGAIAQGTCGMAFKASSGGSNLGSNMLFESAGVSHVGFRVNTSGALEVYRFSNTFTGTLLGQTANSAITFGTWQYVEFSALISATVGTVAINIDGVNALSLTNQNTKNASAATFDTIRFGSAGNNAGGTITIDDVYVTDTVTPLGPRRIRPLAAAADVVQGFSRSTGAANFSLINEAIVNGDTNYVEGQAPGTVDTYSFGALPGTPTTIDAITLVGYSEATDAAARAIALQVISGGTTSDGSSFALNGGYNKFERLLTTDPNTGSAWTAAAVNALQGGPKVIS